MSLAYISNFSVSFSEGKDVEHLRLLAEEDDTTKIESFNPRVLSGIGVDVVLLIDQLDKETALLKKVLSEGTYIDSSKRSRLINSNEREGCTGL